MHRPLDSEPVVTLQLYMLSSPATALQDVTLSSVVVANPGSHVGTILQEFEAHRGELAIRLSGSQGAFTGFTRLAVRPSAVRTLHDDTRIFVVTALRRTSDKTSVAELTAWNADDPTAVIVQGRGVCLQTASSGASSTT